MLRIAQVFNNNVALVNLDGNRQAVAKGRGIAFQKKRGDVIPQEAIEKLFYLDTDTERKNWYYLLKNIPIDVVTTTYEIVDLAQRDYHLKILDYIYITLSDHLHGALKGLQAGTYFESRVPDFHEQYPTEYAIAAKALVIINNNLGVQFPDSEIKNLALHFINAAGESDETPAFSEKPEISIEGIVRQTLKKHGIFRFTSNQNYYDRFMIHLQYLLDRLKHADKASIVIAPEMIATLKQNYPQSFAIATELFDAIKAEMSPELGEDEKLYFVIHIQRLLNEDPHDYALTHRKTDRRKEE